MKNRSRTRRCVTLGVVVFYVVATVLARRRGYSGLGGRTRVRCRDGHVFRTIWVPGVSVTSLRLGWYRFQYCPVGRHWTLVHPIKDSDVDDVDARAPLLDDIGLP